MTGFKDCFSEYQLYRRSRSTTAPMLGNRLIVQTGSGDSVVRVNVGMV